jgi:hypothetical protein
MKSSTKPTRSRVTLDLPIHVKEELDRLCKELKMSRTGVMTLAMQSVIAFRAPEMEKALQNALKRIFKDIVK